MQKDESLPVLGQIIRKLRKRKGLTLQQMGGLLGVSTSNVSRYETGRTPPSSEALFRLLALTDLDHDDEIRVLNDAIRNRIRSGDLVARQIDGLFVDNLEVAGSLEGRSTEDRIRSLGADRILAFRYLTKQVVGLGDVDASLIELMALYISTHGDPRSRALFEMLRQFMEFELSVLGIEKRKAVNEILDPVLKPTTDPLVAVRRRFLEFPQPARRVMIRCPETGKPVFTGVTVTAEEFSAGDFQDMEVWCSHCLITHRWDKADAFLEDAA